MAKKKKTDEQAAVAVEEPKNYPPPRKTNFTKTLDIILTDDEVRQRGILIATIYRDIGKAESALKEEIKERKQAIGKLEMELQSIAYEVREGKRQDEVTCEQSMHFDLLRVVEIRLDTGEEIMNRPFTDEEAMKYRKPELPFDRNKPAIKEAVDALLSDGTVLVGGEDDEDDGVHVIDPELVDPDPEPEPDDEDEEDDEEDEDES